MGEVSSDKGDDSFGGLDAFFGEGDFDFFDFVIAWRPSTVFIAVKAAFRNAMIGAKLVFPIAGLLEIFADSVFPCFGNGDSVGFGLYLLFPCHVAIVCFLTHVRQAIF